MIPGRQAQEMGILPECHAFLPLDGDADGALICDVTACTRSIRGSLHLFKMGATYLF